MTNNTINVPLQYSCLENPMDGGAWKAAVHGVAKSRTRLRDFTFTFHFHDNCLRLVCKTQFLEEYEPSHYLPQKHEHTPPSSTAGDMVEGNRIHGLLWNLVQLLVNPTATHPASTEAWLFTKTHTSSSTQVPGDTHRHSHRHLRHTDTHSHHTRAYVCDTSSTRTPRPHTHTLTDMHIGRRVTPPPGFTCARCHTLSHGWSRTHSLGHRLICKL